MKTSLIAAAVMAISMPAFALEGLAPQSRAYGYMPGASMVLGQGFSMENPLSSPAPCLQNIHTFPNANRKVNQNANVTAYVVTSNSALKTVLGIDTKIDASVLTYSGSGSFDFNSEVDVSSNDATVVIQGDAEYGSDILDLSKASYSPQAQALMTQRNFDAFHQLCGNDLITSVNYGTRVSIVISIKGISSQDKQSINASASGSAGFGPLSASAKVQISSLMKSSQASTEVKMQAFVRGGDGLSNMDELVNSLLAPNVTVDQLRSGIGKIFKSLTAEMAAVTGFTTQPYPGISDSNANFMNAIKQQQLSYLAQNFRYQFSRYNRIFGDLNDQEMSSATPEDFRGVAPGLIANVKVELPSLKQFVSDLAQTHEDCLKDTSPELSKCGLPAKPAMPNLDLLYAMMTVGT